MSKADDKYLEQLWSSWKSSLESFNKALTFVSSGLFAVTYAFIDKVVPLDNAVGKIELYHGWVYIAISIFISLVGTYLDLVFGRFAINWYCETDDPRQRRLRRWSWWIANAINIGAMAFILIGTLHILEFIKINFK